ncbi:MAG: STAS domain-containing protein [Solirubrobacteraceae bacterium]
MSEGVGTRLWGTRPKRFAGRTPLPEATWPGEARTAARSADVLPRAASIPQRESGFRVEKRAGWDTDVVAPVGELDASTVVMFEQAIAGSVQAGRRIMLDLAGLSFIDSCGLWAITTTFTSCRQRGIGFMLSPGPESIQQVFEVTGLYDVLPFLDPGEDAHP